MPPAGRHSSRPRVRLGSPDLLHLALLPDQRYTLVASGGVAVQCVWPILLLVGSNLFMTLAWYGHLKFTTWPLWVVVLGSWGIALFEYVLQVPANRLGNAVFSVTQLKVMQEAITLVVFVGFAWVYFKEVPNWRTGLAVLLVIAAVAIVPRKGENEETKADPPVESRTTDRDGG